MTSSKTYEAAGAFRRALEERLKSTSKEEKIDINRLRRKISFDRLLARLFRDDAAPWVLKGGYALELRFKSARSTIDIDLTVHRVAGAAAGIEKPRVWMISREQQLAEKIHAYTLPRSSQNSRVKDLVDLALLIGDEQLDRPRAVDALRLTFARRGTHALPTSLSAPPEDWETPFRALAEECRLDLDITAVFARVCKFFDNAVKSEMDP
jgi:hypothetical protein